MPHDELLDALEGLEDIRPFDEAIAEEGENIRSTKTTSRFSK